MCTLTIVQTHNFAQKTVQLGQRTALWQTTKEKSIHSIMCKPLCKKITVQKPPCNAQLCVCDKRLCNCETFQPRNCARTKTICAMHNCAPLEPSPLLSSPLCSPSSPPLPNLPLILPKLCLPTITCSTASSGGWFGEKLGITEISSFHSFKNNSKSACVNQI